MKIFNGYLCVAAAAVGILLAVGCGGGGGLDFVKAFKADAAVTKARTTTAARQIKASLKNGRGLPLNLNGRDRANPLAREIDLLKKRTGRDGETGYLEDYQLYYVLTSEGTYHIGNVDTGIVSKWRFTLYEDPNFTIPAGTMTLEIKKINEIGALMDPPNPFPATVEYTFEVDSSFFDQMGVVTVTVNDELGESGRIVMDLENSFGERLQSDVVIDGQNFTGDDIYTDETGFSITCKYTGIFGGGSTGDFETGNVGEEGGLAGTYTWNADGSGQITVKDKATGEQLYLLTFDAEGNATGQYMDDPPENFDIDSADF
ncbi:MAG: hypothetical protein HONBIEJF_01117 [Fimbriimonadaceae bacterium]|nr:hypothetical protein [Fimbriimonadaceae bacterium]